MYRCARVQKYRSAGIQVYRYIGVQVYRFTGIQVLVQIPFFRLYPHSTSVSLHYIRCDFSNLANAVCRFLATELDAVSPSNVDYC